MHQRLSVIGTSQTEKNIFNINNTASKFQAGAVAQANDRAVSGSNDYASKQSSIPVIQIHSAENELADKENKHHLNKFNMRMSKYGHNQFRPSAVISSVVNT